MPKSRQQTEIGAYVTKNLPRPVRSHVDLDRAYEFFNRELFGGILPPCLITLQRHATAYGYFSSARFVNVVDATEVVDEIALNPIHFARQMTPKVLATLVHEMAHLHQFHFGKPSRGRYHNKRWASKMIEIGLVPSSTGKPGGKTTGDRVGHFIRDGGPFDRTCQAFLARDTATLFQDRAYWDVAVGEGSSGEGPDGQRPGGDNAIRERERKAASKTRYRCSTPGCQIAWAKRGSRLICAICDDEMLP